MPPHEYDEEESNHLHMDVVHEIDDRPGASADWAAAIRRLNAIDDPLVRKIVALHRDCGSGSGECDCDAAPVPIAERTDWGCETTALIADHYGLEYRADGDGLA
jgi:hypothetical protein